MAKLGTFLRSRQKRVGAWPLWIFSRVTQIFNVFKFICAKSSREKIRLVPFWGDLPLHKFILEHRKSQKDSSVAVFFVRFIVALGKTIAAKDVFDTTGAVFAGPDIQFIPERVVLIAQYNTILESGHLSSLKKTSPAVTMVLMFIAHSNAVSDSVTFSLVFN